ncbi:MAG: hypothetical protein JW750_11890 [Anaerolineaceae bacterium]|nr:hypothetical protein [Anaerolineaceae bacterium]
MKKMVMFGAGNIGRGFIGQLFSESGYEVIFVDIDQRVLDALNQKRAYTLRLVTNEAEESLQIGPVQAVHSGDVETIAGLLCGVEIAATAVGARVLPFIAPTIAAGIRKRIQTGIEKPLNVIVCENLKGASVLFREMIAEHLDEAGRGYLDQWVGLVDTVIGRMVPPLTEADRAEDPTLVIVEPYKELPVDRNGFVGEPPVVVNMQVRGDFETYTARKLYIHNCGHAVLGYLGFLRGYEYGYEALADGEVREAVVAAMRESAEGITRILGADAAWLDEHIDDLLSRFQNRALGDTVFRLGRDPARKLMEKDRLVGAARLVERAGLTPCALAKGIAAGYCFSPADDPLALELQARIVQEGMGVVMEDISRIRADEPLGRLVLENYQKLRRQN